MNDYDKGFQSALVGNIGMLAVFSIFGTPLFLLFIPNLIMLIYVMLKGKGKGGLNGTPAL
jgi:hypothetical protein